MSDAVLPQVRHQQGRFSGCDGVPLFYQAWLPPTTTPHAVMVNLHGLGDHSGLYPTLANHFPPRGIAIYGYDMRGNGHSPGQRAYLNSWREYRDDLGAFLGRVREWQKDVPLFLLGNSLGGLVVLDYALYHPEGLAGVIAAAPPLGRVGVPAFLMSLGRLMSRLAPRFSLRVGLDLTGLARDTSVIDTVLADPLFHRCGTARLSTELTTTIARVQESAERFALPLLILHGSADRMVPPDGSRQFFAKVRHPDRELREYPGAYHGLLADLDHQQVLQDLERWVESRVGPGRM